MTFQHSTGKISGAIWLLLCFCGLLSLPSQAAAQTDLIYIQDYNSAFDYLPLELLVSARMQHLRAHKDDAPPNNFKPGSEPPAQVIERLACGDYKTSRQSLDAYLQLASGTPPAHVSTWQQSLLWAAVAAQLQASDAALRLTVQARENRLAADSQTPQITQRQTGEDIALAHALAQRDANDADGARRSINALLQIAPDDASTTFRKRNLHLQAAKVELELKTLAGALDHLEHLSSWYRTAKDENVRNLQDVTITDDKTDRLADAPMRLQYVQSLCLEAETHLSLFYLETHDVRNLLRADILYTRAREHFNVLRQGLHAFSLFPLLQELGRRMYARALGVSYLAYQETGLESHAEACFATAEERKQFNYWRAAVQTMPLAAHAGLPSELRELQRVSIDGAHASIQAKNGQARAAISQEFIQLQASLQQNLRYSRIFSRKSPPSIRSVFDQLGDSSLFLHLSIAERHIYTARFFEGKFSIRRARFTDKVNQSVATAYNAMRSGKTEGLSTALRTLFQALLAQHVHADSKRMHTILISPDSTLFALPFGALAARSDSRREKPGDLAQLQFAAERLTFEYVYCAADFVAPTQAIDKNDLSVQLISPARSGELNCEEISAQSQAQALREQIGKTAGARFLTSSGTPRSLRYATREAQAIGDQVEMDDADLKIFSACNASPAKIDGQNRDDTGLAAYLAHTNFVPTAPAHSGILLAPGTTDTSGFLTLRQLCAHAPQANVMLFPYSDLRNGQLPDAISVGAFLSAVQTRSSGHTAFSLWNASTAFSFEFLQSLSAAAHQPEQLTKALTETRRKFIAQERLAHPLRWARLVLYRY